jgi:thioesterase domain-containing protein
MATAEEPTTYLVECFWPGIDERQHAAAANRAQAAALQLRREGEEIEFLGSILIPGDETVFCFFKGREPDVRGASERAGLPFERLLAAVRIAADSGRAGSERRSL